MLTFSQGRLPTLHNPETGTWTASLASITRHLLSNPPPTFRSPDRHLTPTQLAKSTAYTTHLPASAGPLLSLSLYASTTNWTSSVRPAYSSTLPFPLPWTEVLPLRRAWLSLADTTGVDLLDAEDAERPAPPPPQSDDVPVPNLPRGRTGPKDVLTPEQKARIRLQGMVDGTMAVLRDLKAGKTWFLAEDGRGPTTLDCVAFGYLALMVAPDLPRPWLRDMLVEGYPDLQAFVTDMTAACFGDGLPGPGDGEGRRRTGEDGAARVVGRFADGVARNVPWFGEVWGRWRDVGVGVADVLALAGGSLVAVVLVAAYVLHRRGLALMPVLGAPMHRWEAPRRGLAGFGAAGALFGGLFAPEVRFGGVGGESGRVRTDVQAPFGGKADGVEVDVNVDID